MTSPVGSSAMGLQQIMEMRQSILDKSQSLQNIRVGGAQAETPGVSSTQAAPGGGFADTLKTALDGVNATQQRASDISAAYERGEVTDVSKVMLARQEAGIAFEATLQVRNKLLSAYLDILKMGV
jgi:flagellar hook-basal body complex protein FliE